MKRFILLVLLGLMFCVPSYAGSITKGEQSASAVQFAGSCEVTFIKLVEGGNDSTLTLYNSATATTSGKVKMDFLEAEDGDSQAGGPISKPLIFDQGCYAVLTGASASYYIHVVGR